jgi:hypothetical protein
MGTSQINYNTAVRLVKILEGNIDYTMRVMINSELSPEKEQEYLDSILHYFDLLNKLKLIIRSRDSDGALFNLENYQSMFSKLEDLYYYMGDRPNELNHYCNEKNSITHRIDALRSLTLVDLGDDPSFIESLCKIDKFLELELK